MIEPPSIDQLSGTKERVPRESSREEEQSPRTRAKQRWRSAIDQQIILNRMDRINKQFTSERGSSTMCVEATIHVHGAYPKLYKNDIMRKPISRGAEWSKFQLHSTFHRGV